MELLKAHSNLSRLYGFPWNLTEHNIMPILIPLRDVYIDGPNIIKHPVYAER